MEGGLAVARAELVLNAAVFRNDANGASLQRDETRNKWAEQTEAVIAGTSINERWKKLEDAEYESHNRACDAESQLTALRELRDYVQQVSDSGDCGRCFEAALAKLTTTTGEKK